MQNFWKDHTALRLILMAVLFVVGIALLIVGWKMTGQLNGLWIMLVGLALVLACLWLYNRPFQT